MKTEGFELYQIKKGGLVVIKKKNQNFDFGFNNPTVGLNMISIKFTFDFVEWDDLTLLCDKKQFSNIESLLAVQLGAIEVAKIEDINDYQITKIASIENYRIWTAIGRKDGKNHISAFPINKENFSSINHFELSCLGDVYEDNLFIIKEKTTPFLEFVQQQELTEYQKPV